MTLPAAVIHDTFFGLASHGRAEYIDDRWRR
jgi:hypothetical protein